MALISISKAPDAGAKPTWGDRVRGFFNPGAGHREGDIFSGPAELHGGLRDAAYKTHERPQSEAPLLSSDGKVENRERIALMKESRRLFENVAAVKGAEKVHSRFATPVMWYAATGDDDVDHVLNDYIAKQMESSNFDLAQEHDLPTSVGSAIIDWGVDGDVFANFVRPQGEDKFGVQWVRAHRVGKKDEALDVSDELSDKFRLRAPQRFTEVGGIVKDSRERRRAIRVYPIKRDESFLTKEKPKTIPWAQVTQIYDPLKTDRMREVTRWNGAIPAIIDLEQTWRYLQATIKQQVASPIVKKTKDGKVPKTSRKRPSLDENTPTVGTDEKPLKEIVPGQFQYLRNGEEIADFTMQRPNATFFDCVEYLLRTGALAIDMPYPFVFESKGLNGGTLRLENSKAAASMGYYRNIVRKRFLDEWVRAKILEGIRLGALPYSASQLSELAKGRWAWPELPTADEKYRDATTISLYESGLCSGQDVVGPKGTTIEAVQDQKDKESRRAVMLAMEAHKEFPLIPLDWWVDRISKVGPNGSISYRFPSDVEEDDATSGDGSENDGGGTQQAHSARELEARLTSMEVGVSQVQNEVRATRKMQGEMMEQLELAL